MFAIVASFVNTVVGKAGDLLIAGYNLLASLVGK